MAKIEVTHYNSTAEMLRAKRGTGEPYIPKERVVEKKEDAEEVKKEEPKKATRKPRKTAAKENE